jgi:hypothetical protein
MHEHAKVKRAINTLDHPIWNPNRAVHYKMIKEADYLLVVYKNLQNHLPKSKDIDVLNRLLYVAQKNRSNILRFHSVSSLLKEMGYKKSKKNVDNVLGSLLNWTNIRICFPNSEKHIKDKSYEVIEKVKIEGYITSGRKRYVEIYFDRKFYELNNSQYSVYLPIKPMEDLKPYTKRLYEILVKSFYKREHYNIGIPKLLEKIPYSTYGIQPHFEFNRIVRSGVKEMKHLLNVSVSRKGDVFYFTHKKA